jgi:hypothetical protein
MSLVTFQSYSRTIESQLKSHENSLSPQDNSNIAISIRLLVAIISLNPHIENERDIALKNLQEVDALTQNLSIEEKPNYQHSIKILLRVLRRDYFQDGSEVLDLSKHFDNGELI